MNILSKWKQRRANRRRLRELNQTATAFASLDRLQKANLLTWEPKNRRLLIAQPLATIYMQQAETWLAFLQNVYLWTYYTASSEAWEQFMQKEELAAVRRAVKEKPNLAREDIDRIRRARRAEIAQSDMQPPRVEGFEFFIVRETQDVEAQVVLVGFYNPENDDVEMATWDEVRRLLDRAAETEKK